jgi:oligoendopeptidase F
MTFVIDLPTSPDAFAQATWDDILPYYHRLAEHPLNDDSVEPWLATWSELDSLIGEAATLSMIRYTGNTADADAEAAYLRFSSDISPKLDEQQVGLARRLLATGYSRPDIETMLRRFRRDDEIFRAESVPLMAEIEELSAAYQKTTGGLSVEWDGETKTIPQLQPYLKVADRSVRERAFRAGADAYSAHRDALAELFDKMYALRTRVAANAGFADYMHYCFAAKQRFDYTPDDCARFHDAVEETVVPAVARAMEVRRQKLGVDTLRPWDTNVDVTSRTPLTPFATVGEFEAGARRIFSKVDAELGARFNLMADEKLLDLESRPGKAPGGYCTDLSHRGRPFIFMNAVGVPDDVTTLVHEAGHCFHDFAAHPLPLVWQRRFGHEAAELASMSMELLASPYLAKPVGYYDEDAARSARLEHLEDILLGLPHIASVDAFQRWIYTDPAGADADARDAKWLELRARFESGVDWSGLDRERVARWYRQLHIFELPFYYIEYGIAQMGALQVWRNARRDQADAVRRYKSALALGGTKPLPEIYAAAGAKLVFDAPTMRELVQLVEDEMHLLRA